MIRSICRCVGAVGIWKSYECQQAKQRGDLQRAQQESGTARTLFIVSLVLGILVYVVIIGITIYYTVFAAAVVSNVHDDWQDSLERSRDDWNKD